MASTTVTVRQGRLQGKECISCYGQKYLSFEGIPYAKPPVGRLRFRDPQPPEPWTGIRDATKPGSRCAQMDPYGKQDLEGSEDCLYLNVYTPSLPAEKLEKLPVLFFVHGGRYLVGYGDYYRPDYFIQHNVILVTINYRLHVLGFLCLNIPECPGNAAFKDTILALRWVNQNIGQFNGDSSNVTAFGESAGAGLVSSYLTIKMSDGLVHKVIAQSGVCISDLLMIEEDPIEKAKLLASNLGKELADANGLYEFLVDVPLADLVYAATAAELSRPPYIINAFFLPVVEKKFEGIERCIEEFQLANILNNRHKKMPVLCGLNSHEGALFLQKDADGNIFTINDVQRFIPRFLGIEYNSQKSRKLAEKLKEYYFGSKNIAEAKEEYVNFSSDANFNRDIIMFAEMLSKHSKDVYLYNFRYTGNMNTRVMKSLGLKGASHGDIIQYQFYRENKAKLCTDQDARIIKFITEAWCNFARNGKPTWSNQKTSWPSYSPDKHLCVNIDQDLEISEYPNWGRIKFWLDHMGERSKL